MNCELANKAYMEDKTILKETTKPEVLSYYEVKQELRKTLLVDFDNALVDLFGLQNRFFDKTDDQENQKTVFVTESEVEEEKTLIELYKYKHEGHWNYSLMVKGVEESTRRRLELKFERSVMRLRSSGQEKDEIFDSLWFLNEGSIAMDNEDIKAIPEKFLNSTKNSPKIYFSSTLGPDGNRFGSLQLSIAGTLGSSWGFDIHRGSNNILSKIGRERAWEIKLPNYLRTFGAKGEETNLSRSVFRPVS